MSILQDHYKNEIIPALMKDFKFKSIMEVPKITKITLNMGVGEALGDKKALENAVADLTLISGQKPVVNNARKSIAGFKILIKKARHHKSGMGFGIKEFLKKIYFCILINT